MAAAYGSLFNFSESGRGGGDREHSYYILALRLLDYMGFAIEEKTEWKMGGTHSSPTALELRISAPTHPSQISEFCLGLGGGTKVFYPPRPHIPYAPPPLHKV